MKQLVYCLLICTCLSVNSLAQTIGSSYDQHGVVWSAGLFKSWLTDTSVDFHNIEDVISPVYTTEKKQGLAMYSHYMYKPHRLVGVGVHLGLGLDVSSYLEAPVLLFGGSISYGHKHQFILTFGWADAERKFIRSSLRQELDQAVLTEIPVIVQETQLNTGFYLGISYSW